MTDRQTRRIVVDNLQPENVTDAVRDASTTYINAYSPVGPVKKFSLQIELWRWRAGILEGFFGSQANYAMSRFLLSCKQRFPHDVMLWRC